MSFSLLTLLEAAVITSALSIDAFISSLAYGSNKIKIPPMSVFIINIICSLILGISLIAGSIVKPYLPEWLTVTICFGVLFIIGILKLFDSITKSIIRRYNSINKEISFSMFNFHFILNLYANPEDADVDTSKIISPIEAASLAIALSLDGIAVGFGAAMGNINGLAIFLFSFIANEIAVILGCYCGNKIANKIDFNISWVGGAVLIILAVLKLL